MRTCQIQKRLLSGSSGAGQFVLLLLIVAVLGRPAYAGTTIVHRWVLTGEPIPQIKKILIIAVLDNYLIRQELEDEMEKLLAKFGVQGIRSHMVLPPRNEVLPGEMKQRIKEGDYDGVLVIRPKASRKESEEVVTAVSYVPPPGYYTFGPYWNIVGGQFAATESYFKENTVVSTEFNLYKTRDEKLIWSGEADTIYSGDFEKLGKRYASALVKQLKKDKVIGKK